MKMNKMKEIEYEITRDKVDGFMCAFGMHTGGQHFHKQMEIVYCHFGRQSLVINNQPLLLKQGDVAIISPFVAHGYLRSKALCTVVCIPTIFYSYYNPYFSNLDACNMVIPGRKHNFMILRAMRKFKTAGRKNYLEQLAIVADFLGKLQRQFPDLHNAGDGANDDLTILIIEYINQNFTKKISLETLSEQFHYNKSYISSIFKKNFVCGFNDYLNLIRLNAFIELQMKNGGSFAQNALLVGFPSARTFYNVFKAKYNQTPSDYFKLQK